MNAPVIDNRTELRVHPQLLLDRNGEKLLCVVKATFEVDAGKARLAPPARARVARAADIPWQKEKPNSLAYPADVCLRKPGTDVVVVARAETPGGRAMSSFDARVEVGALSKSITIFGRRLWLDGGSGLTDPAPTQGVEVRYDLAWGGRDESDPKNVVEEPRNPAGMGLCRDKNALTHALAPCIEDPNELISTVDTAPAPAGLSPIGRDFMPRRRYAGTYDDAWQTTRAPLLPDDFDDRYNQFASPGLFAERPLIGGEAVRLLNLTRGGGAFSFALPRISLEIEFRSQREPPQLFTPPLDTVVLDSRFAPKDVPLVLEMIFRASIPAPRRLRQTTIVVRERGLA